MCFGGGDNEDDPYAGLDITNVQRSDPETEARQKMLWDQAQQFASSSPYTSQYGGPDAIPGMSGMSQRGQQYLTNSILGPDTYQDPAQNLGFSDYSRPDSAEAANTWNFTNAPPVVTGGGLPPVPPIDDPLAPPIVIPPKPPVTPWVPPVIPPEPPPLPPGGGGPIIIPPKPPEGPYVPYVPPVEPPPFNPNGPVVTGGGGGGGEPGPFTGEKGVFSGAGGLMNMSAGPGGQGGQNLSLAGGQQQMQQQMQQRERQAQQSITPQMESKYATLQAQIAKEGAAQRADPRIGQSLRSPEEQELLRTFSMARATPQGMGMQSQQLQQMQQPQMGGMQGLLEAGATGDSKTVGIGEMELAADATQRLLEQQGPQNPSWERITDPTIGGTTVGNVADVGNTAIGAPTAFELDRVAAPELAGVGAGAVERVSASNIAGPAGVTIDPFTGQTAEALQDIGPGTIAGPGELALDPVTGQATSAVGGVAPGEFGGSSFLGGPAISDYMNTAGTDAAVTQARQDYEVALNREKSRQAQVGAFGSRGTVEEAGLIAAQERNIAQIRGAGFDRAAQMMEADTGRRQQAGLQSQQLGFQGGMAGQALEAQRRESDASRAQQAALQGQQLGFQGQLQTQQLAQSGDIRGAELGLQASMQGQQLEAQRRSEEAARYQQAGLAGQQLQAQSGMQTQQLQQQASIQGAQNALNAAQSNQRVAMQSGSEQKQLEAARQIEEARLGLSAAQQTQQLGAQTGMQTQELGTQVAIQNAQNEMRSAEQNMQSALQTGSQQAQIDAQRQMSQSQMRLDAATRNQQAGLQSAGMGLDAQGQFREQQMDAAQQLADIGGMEQGATFNAAGQLQQMGGQQERAQMLQQAWDYEQWLRGQQGGADSLRLMNSMMPGGSQETLDRGPDRFGQILGAGTAVGGAYIGRDRSGSDVRVKENITYAGTKNGFNVYDFNYLGGDNRYRGVMAQEVMKQRPDAVESRNGVYWVDYGALGIQMEAV